MPTLPGAVSDLTDEQMDASLDSLEDAGSSPLRGSLIQSLEADREKAARASQLGRDMGVPADMAERNLEALEREKSIENFDFEGLERDHPLLSDYLSDANNAKLFSDEIGFWTGTSDVLGSFAGQGLGRSVGAGVSGLGYQAGLTSRRFSEADERIAEITGLPRLNPVGPLVKSSLALFSDIAQPSGAVVEQAGEAMEPPEERQNLATDVAGGVGQAVANIGLSLIPGVGPSLMAGQGIEQQKDRMDAAGIPEDQRSALTTAGGGAVTLATEMVEAKFLLKGLKAFGVTEEAMGQSLKQLLDAAPAPLRSKWAGALAGIGGAATAEATQELSEGFLQDLIEYASYNQDVEFMKDWKETAEVAGATGAVTKALIMGIGSIGRSSAHIRGQDEGMAKTKAEIDAIKALATQARAGQSVQRDPVKFQELMTLLNAGGRQVFITPETAMAFNQDGIDPADLLRIAPEIGASLNEALNTGGDVAVPVDKIIGLTSQTDKYDFIFDHLRTSADGPTLKESTDLSDPEAANMRIREILDEERARVADEVMGQQGMEDSARIEDRIYNSLLNTGRETAATARAQAGLLRKIYETLTERAGTAPLAQRLMSRFENLEAIGPRPAFRYRPNEFDVLIDDAKRRARSRQSKEDKPAETDLLGDTARKKRGKSGPTPVINFIAARGGVARNSPMAAELAAMDITPASHPRLFRKGGMKSLDNIPASEVSAALADRALSAKQDGNGYADPAWLLEQMRAESFGEGVDTVKNQEKQRQEDYLDQLLDVLDRASIDVLAASNADIKAALARYQADLAAGEGVEALNQDENSVKTDTPEFKKWFGDSKVVDSDGKPLVVYHGSLSNEIHEFMESKRGSGTGAEDAKNAFFFSDSGQVASTYADELDPYDLGMTGIINRLTKGWYKKINETAIKPLGLSADKRTGAVYPVYLSAKNPLVVDYNGKEYNEPDFMNFMHDATKGGHDGLIVNNVLDEGFVEGIGSPSSVYAVFSPTQIKSVHNRGTFDPNDARILYQNETGAQGPRGSVSFLNNGRTLIQLFETSDRSTFLHESAHFFLDVMRDVFTDPAAPDQFKADWQGTLDWFKSNEKAVLKEAARQKAFAVAHDADAGLYYLTGWDGSRVEYGDRASAQAEADARNEAARTALAARGEGAVATFVDGGWTPQDAADYLIYRATHEQFARGFEALLFKGEAPSIEVRSLFETFRAWLQRVYKYAIENLNVKVSPEMQAIFNRLIATDAEIEEARANNPIFRPDPQTMEMLSEEEKREYIKLNERQMQNARNKLFRKAMRQHERQATQWYKEERAKVAAEQEEVVNNSALHRAATFFTTGKAMDGTVISSENHKLNRKAIVDEFGEGILKYLPRGLTTAKGGIDPVIGAEMFGYRNKAEMIRAMTGMESRKQAVERMTDEEMIRRHGDMMLDGTLEREALESLMAENPAAQMFELGVLTAKSKPKTGLEYPSDLDFARAAAALLAEKKVDEAIKPDQYLRAALRARGLYAKNAALKKFDKAAQAKRQEILNRHAYKQAVEAREDVDKALKHFAVLARKPKKQKKLAMDAEYRDKILELLARVNLAPRVSAGRALRLELNAINQWIQEKLTNENAQLVLPPELQTADGLTHYRDMTLAEFMAFRDLVYNVETQGRKKMELIVEGRRRQLAADAQEGAKIVHTHNRTKPHQVNPDDQNIPSYLTGLTEKAETLIRKLDGGATKGFIWERLRGGIFEGEIKEQEMQAEAGRKMQKIIARHYGTVKIGGYTAAAEDITSKKTAVFINGRVGSLTRAERISVLLNMGNRDNLEKLMDGSKTLSPIHQEWTREDLDQIVSTLREKDALFAQEIWDLLDEYWPPVRALQRERLGYAPEKVEAEPLEIVTADGKTVKLRGGYYRLKYNGRLLARSNGYEMAELANAMMQGSLAGTQTKRGSTNERRSGVRQPLLLNLSVIDSHLNEVIHDLALGEAVRNASKFLHHPTFAQAVIDTQGMEGMEALELWLGDIAAGGLTASSRTDKMFQNLRHSATMGSLMLKYSTVVVQLTGFANSIVELRPQWAAVGLAAYGKLGGPFGAGAKVAAKSRYMAQRGKIMSRDLAATLKKLDKNGALSDAQRLALEPMLRLQYVVDTVTWLGGYEKALAAGKRAGKTGDDLEKDAVRAADLAVDSAQGSSFISALSATERGTTGKKTRMQEAIKTWTLFMSYFNAKINIAIRRTRGTKVSFADPAGSAAAVASLAADYMILFWAEFVVGEAILGRWPDFEDDDEDGPLMAFFKWSVGGMGSTVAAGVPFFRDAAGAFEGFGGGPAAARGLGQIGQATGTVAREVRKFTEGEDVNAYKAAKAAVSLGNYASPVKYPAGQINALLDAMDRAEQGEDVDFLDYLRYDPNQ